MKLLSLPSFTLACIAAISVGCVHQSSTSNTTPTGPSWYAAPPMVFARSAHAVVADEDGIFALGGTGANRQPVMGVERFDGTRWVVVSQLPGNGLNAPSAALIGKTLYLIGGFSTTTNVPIERVWRYDTTTHGWTEGVPLPTPRGGHGSAVHRGKIHVVGGGNSTSTLADHDAFDPQRNTWQSLAPLPRGTGSPAVISHLGRLYAIGGRSGYSDFAEVYSYDDASNRWDAAPMLPLPARGTSGVAIICDAVHLFGGETQTQRRALGDVLRLDHAAGTWQALPPLPTPRNFARAVSFRGNVFVVGGNAELQGSHASTGTTVVERLSPRC